MSLAFRGFDMRAYTVEQKACAKIKMHDYYLQHKSEIYAKNRRWYKANSGKVLASQRIYRKLHPEIIKATVKRSKRSLRLEILSEYGHRCVCCGENREPFLTIEHIGGGGESHRKSVNGEVYRDIRKQGFPKDKYSILCWNCNCSTRFGKLCPHKQELLCESVQ